MLEIANGADGIVIQENTESGDGSVTVNQSIEPGTFIRPKGLDIDVGDVLVEAGARLSARDAALIASNNTASVTVYRKPVVAILATGDELVMPGEPMGPGGSPG